jgi:hypothetical protein
LPVKGVFFHYPFAESSRAKNNAEPLLSYLIVAGNSIGGRWKIEQVISYNNRIGGNDVFVVVLMVFYTYIDLKSLF